MQIDILAAEQLGPCLGQGGSSRVYEFVSPVKPHDGIQHEPPDHKAAYVVKLYQQGTPLEVAIVEFENSKTADRSQIPTPSPIRLVEYGKQIGIQFERCVGRSMLDTLTTDAALAGELISKFASLHVYLHHAAIVDIESEHTVVVNANAKQRSATLLQTVIHNRELPTAATQRLVARLADAQDPECFCHFDFHPGNLMNGQQGWQIVDWQNAQMAPSWADVASTLIKICFATPRQLGAQLPKRIAGLSSLTPKPSLTPETCATFARAYLGAYVTQLRNLQRPLDAPNEALSDWIQIIVLDQIQRASKLEHRRRLRQLLDDPSSIMGELA